MRGASLAAPASSSERRPYAARASARIFQLPTTCSTGASARPSRIVQATVTPGEAWPEITSQAPTDSITICTAWRSVRVKAAMDTVLRAVGPCSAVTSAFTRCQRASSASVMPRVCTTSALAKDASR